jgi:hypothetical protein
MTNPIIPIVVVGGLAYELVGKTGDVAPLPHPVYTGASYPGQPVNALRNIAAKNPHSAAAFALASRNYSSQNTLLKPSSWPSDANIDPNLQAKLDTVEAAAQKAYNDANEVAKAQAADTLNKQLKLDPPLNGHEDWETVSAVVGGATGGAIGGAIGGPIGAKIGAMAGAYLGVKLEDLLAKNLDEIEDWIKGKWGDIEDFAKDAYDDVAGLWPF